MMSKERERERGREREMRYIRRRKERRDKK